MRRETLIAAASVLAAAFPLAAQATWIVDPNGGGHFLDLNSAVAAASANDTLLLRGGDYPHVTLSVPLNLVGDGPMRTRIRGVDRSIAVSNASCSFTGIDINFLRLLAPTSLENVQFSRCDVSNTSVSIHRCTFGGPVDLYGVPHTGPVIYVWSGSVAITDSTGSGSAPFVIQTLSCTVWDGYAPINVFGGTVAIAGCNLHGPNSMPVWCSIQPLSNPGPAVRIDGGGASVTRSTVVGGAALSGANTSPVQLNFFGATFVADPSTQFTPPNTVGSATFLPATSGFGAAPGGVMTCTVEGPSMQLAGIVAELGLRAPISVPEGMAWVSPATHVLLAIGLTNGSGLLQAAIQVPVTVQRGIAVTTQGVVLAPNGSAFAAAVPVVLHVR